jgi:hypothetical protein
MWPKETSGSEMTPLKISTEQMIALHGFFAEAAAVGEAALAEISGCETEIEVHEVRCTPLGEFGEQGLRLSEDLVAGVIGRLEGAMPGSLNIVLEPEEALVWAQIGNDGDPLDTFVALGTALLEGVAVGLSEILECESHFCSGVLVEESELAMFVKTHAPSDTLVCSTRLRIDVRDEVVSAVSHLLIDPKYLAQLLSALSAAVH